MSIIGRPPTKIDLTKAIELYKGNLSIQEVAKLIGTHRSVIQRRFKKLGICKDKGWFNRGRKLSLEVRKKMSLGKIKLLSNPKEKERLFMGKNNPFYGKKHKPETIEAMKRKLSILLSGANNPQWKGGISIEPYAPDFKPKRQFVYARDNYQCQNCGVVHIKGRGRLVSHHMDRDKMNSKIENLVTLCRPCHGKITMGQRWNKEVLQP